MNKEEIVGYVLDNPTIDFVAKIITPFHMIGLQAFLLELCKVKKRLVNGVVLIEKHSVSGYAINISEVNLEEYGDIVCVYYSNDSKNDYGQLKIAIDIKKDANRDFI